MFDYRGTFSVCIWIRYRSKNNQVVNATIHIASMLLVAMDNKVFAGNTYFQTHPASLIVSHLEPEAFLARLRL